jgi:uncharacterized protein YbjT (DUF2867 family)
MIASALHPVPLGTAVYFIVVLKYPGLVYDYSLAEPKSYIVHRKSYIKMRVIVTGASGMVGEGVLLECLNHSEIEQVLVIGRRPCGVVHPRLKEILHKDFFNLAPIENELKGYEACYFCLGVSSIGMKEDEYTKMTYQLTMHVAQALVKHNPGMTFCYISGAGTDSTEKGKLMWARVKGKTENDLKKLGFRHTFAFRPGGIIPTDGQKNILKVYNYVGWLLPVMRFFSKNAVSNVSDIAKAMIGVTKNGYKKDILEVSDINSFGKSN